MSLLREVEWEACLLEPQDDPQLIGELRKRHGRIGSTLAYFLPCPQLTDALATLSALNLVQVEIEPVLQDMIGVTVSQDHSCRYCYAVQRALMRATGLPEEKIRLLAERTLTANLSARDRAALEFARRVSRSNPLATRQDAKRLEEHGCSEFLVREIAAVVGLNCFFNRLSTLPALPPGRMEDLPDRWYIRMLQPLFARFVASLRSKRPRTYLSEEEKTGPFSSVVVALDGLPHAGAIRGCIDSLFAGEALPLRTKALMFAVVGRALGCSRSVEEGTALALDAGVDRGTIDEVLAHLRSDGLSEAEATLLPLARETVWYEPVVIQRRTREVRDRLGAEGLIEFIVTVSAANMICRVGSVVVDD